MSILSDFLAKLAHSLDLVILFIAQQGKQDTVGAVS